MFGFAIGASLTAFAQALPAPAAVPHNGVRAMHCIKSGDRDWLIPPPSGNSGTLRFGFTRDRKSYPDQSHVIVVVYESRSKGQVFDLLEKPTKGQVRLIVVNNGRFSVTGSKVQVDEILGGVWTNQFLTKAIRAILADRSFSVQVSRLKQSFPDTVCSSYAAK